MAEDKKPETNSFGVEQKTKQPTMDAAVASKLDVNGDGHISVEELEM